MSVSSAECRIAVIILNYRTHKLVEDCLRTVVPDIDQDRDRIVVVDNDSGDGSYETISSLVEREAWLGFVKVIASPRNDGFACGNNVGIRSVSAEAYLLLNSDTLIRPGAVSQMWSAMCEVAQTGIVGPRLEWPDATPQVSCFRYHSPLSELVRGACSGPVTKLFRSYDTSPPLNLQRHSPQWMSGAALLVRRGVFDQVGYLDESFFMYYEDMEFCRRAADAGWVLMYEPDARVVHLRGGTSPVKQLERQKKRRPAYFYESRRTYFRKVYGLFGLFAANLFWSGGHVIDRTRELVGNRPMQAVQREFHDTWLAKRV